MKILAVNSLRGLGGGERWLVRQSLLWRDAGCRIDVAAPPGAAIHAALLTAGVNSHPIEMRHDVSPVAIIRLAQAMIRLRPDVVLLCTERAVRLAAPASLLAGRPPLIFRNGLTRSFKNRWINRLWIPLLERVVVNARELQREMEGFGWIRADQLSRIENGVEMPSSQPSPAERLALRSSLGADEDDTVILTLARLDREKGLHDLLDALGSLARTGIKPRLWIAGEGAQRPALQSQAQALGVAPDVSFLGQRPDASALLHAADLFVLPSYREGRSNAVLEAMACAKPVVATGVGGLPDLVTPGQTGALVEPGEPDQLAAALEQFIQSPELRLRMGAAGRRRAAKFSIEHEARQWIALFGEIAGAGLSTAAPAGSGRS